MSYNVLSSPILVLRRDITIWGVVNPTIYCKNTCYVRSRHHVLRLNRRPKDMNVLCSVPLSADVDIGINNDVSFRRRPENWTA